MLYVVQKSKQTTVVLRHKRSNFRTSNFPWWQPRFPNRVCPINKSLTDKCDSHRVTLSADGSQSLTHNFNFLINQTTFRWNYWLIPIKNRKLKRNHLEVLALERLCLPLVRKLISDIDLLDQYNLQPLCSTCMFIILLLCGGDEFITHFPAHPSSTTL